MDEKERLENLMATIDSLKRENVRLQAVIQERNIEINKLRQLAASNQRAASQKRIIDRAMERLSDQYK